MSRNQKGGLANPTPRPIRDSVIEEVIDRVELIMNSEEPIMIDFMGVNPVMENNRPVFYEDAYTVGGRAPFRMDVFSKMRDGTVGYCSTRVYGGPRETIFDLQRVFNVVDVCSEEWTRPIPQ
jgi:hypothetical protein